MRLPLGVTLWVLVGVGGALGEGNLVVNGSFEQLTDERPAGWIAAGDAAVTQTLTLDAGRTGGHSAKLECSGYARHSPASHAMLAQVDAVFVTAGETYRFSCWARAQGIRSRSVQLALVDTRNWENCGLSGELRPTGEWRRFEILFRASRTVTERSRLQFWFTENGTLWVDDVELVKVPPQPVRFSRRIEPTGSRNLLPNASFECGPDGWSSLGQRTGWGNLSGLFGSVVTDEPQHGRRSLRIELGPGKTPVTFFDYFQPVRIEQKAPLAANVGWVTVEKGSAYTLSAWMRADAEGVPASLLIRQCDPASSPVTASKGVILSREWQRYSLTVQASRGSMFVAVGPDLRKSPTDAAVVWIDAVQLEKGGTASDFTLREPIEIGFDSGRFGNIFPSGPASLTITGENATASPVTITLHAETQDFFGRTLPAEEFNLSIPATGSAAVDWPLKLPGKGYYRTTVSWQSGGQTHSRSIRLAMVKPYQEADSPFGINHAPATKELCAALRVAGVLWARDWSVKWQDVEPVTNELHFDVPDAQIDRTLAAGLRPLCLLPPFPSANWASSAPETLDTRGYPGVRLRMAYAPRDPQLLARFIEKAAEHYRGKVHSWEFLNEPVYTDYALPGANSHLPGAAYTVADYVALLKLAYAAMKRADPDCLVVGGIGSGPEAFTTEFIEAGGLDAVDALNLHTYPGARAPESFLEPLANLNQRMKRAGGTKPIWVTEYSYYGADELPWEPFIPSPDDWAANRLLTDERECAEYSVRFAVVMLAGGAEKIFYHSGGNGDVNQESLESCLFAAAGEPRRVYPAQSALANVLGPQPRFVAQFPLPSHEQLQDGLYGFLFQCGKQAVLVAWADLESAGPGWRLRCSSDESEGPNAPERSQTQPVAYDIMGNRIPAGDIPLTGSPVYLVSDTLSPEALARGCAFLPPTK
jgi:hypothetical protein